MGAVQPLTEADNWTQFGTVTPDQAAAAMFDMIEETMALDSPECLSDDIAPYWDDPDGDDASGEYNPGEGAPYYFRLDQFGNLHEAIEDFVIAAFVAIASTPATAIVYLTIAPKFRLAWRTRDIGGIVKIIIDAVTYTEVDTYSPTDGLVFLDVEVPSVGGGGGGVGGGGGGLHEIRLVYEGNYNPLSVPNAQGNREIQTIRKRLYPEEVDSMSYELRQNPANSCQLQQSIDGGNTWSLAFDYSLCVANSIPEVPNGWDIDNPSSIDSRAPQDTWTHSEGESTEDAAQRTLAFCAAIEALVDEMLDAFKEAYEKQGEVIDAVVAAAAVVAALAAIFGPAAAPFVIGLAIVIAALQVVQSIHAANAYSVIEDAAARAEVACMVYTYMRNRPISKATMQAAFDDPGCLSTEAGYLRQIIRVMMMGDQVDRIYMGFVAMLGSATTAARSGATLPDCDFCEGVSWCFEILPAQFLEWFVIEYGTLEADGLHTGATPGLGTTNCRMEMKSAVYISPDTTITNISMFYSLLTNSGVDLFLDDQDGAALYGGVTVNPGVYQFNGGSYSKSDVLIRPEFAIFTNGLSDVSRIVKIQLSGTGISPFDICDNCT